jgi:hypothetical protein
MELSAPGFWLTDGAITAAIAKLAQNGRLSEDCFQIGQFLITTSPGQVAFARPSLSPWTESGGETKAVAARICRSRKIAIPAPHYPALLNQQVNPPRQRATWHSDDVGDTGFGEGLTLQVPDENHPPTSIRSRACGSFLSGKRKSAHARVRNRDSSTTASHLLLADFIADADQSGKLRGLIERCRHLCHSSR